LFLLKNKWDIPSSFVFPLTDIRGTKRRFNRSWLEKYQQGLKIFVGGPFSEYELICEIQVKNGLDLGENYRNINGCKTFAASIAKTLVDKQVQFQILSYTSVEIFYSTCSKFPEHSRQRRP
jgi:hypothetical protein